VIQLEFAWEPRFQPFLLEVGTCSVLYGADASGRKLQVQQPSQGQVDVNGRTAHEVEIRVPAPKRSAAQIEALKGNLTLILPSKMLRLTFPKLSVIKKPNQAITQNTPEGISVSVSKLVQDDDRWLVEMALHYPTGGPTFESFRSWLGNNQISLVKGKERWLPNADEERVEQVTATQAVIQYVFADPSGKKNPADWTLVYHTPGRIVEVTAPFAFTSLPLP
jgi:hypothetical protein